MPSVKSILDPVAKKDFEAILGRAYFSDDDAVLSGYAWTNGISKVPPAGEVFAPFWPVAVALPSSTEEVAEIVKCCKRHGLSFKAQSTGYGAVANVVDKDCVSIDLRRMNQMTILPEDRMAILDPYVTAGQLQAEAIKHGMTCHIVGAGPVHSPLASAAAFMGIGISGQSTSTNVRNLLSWEWVTPEGDIVRGGSAGESDDWSSSDGPGPGMRGMIRGLVGSSGGMGVFTKIGYKLYPVPTKEPIGAVGKLPQIGSPIPENFGFYQAVWPDWESQTEASFELVQDNLTFAMLRMPPTALGWTVTANNAEYISKLEDGTLPPVAQFENEINWSIGTMSRSAREHRWRANAVKNIVEKTGGRLIELAQEDAQMLYRGLVTAQYVARALRPTAGGLLTSFGINDSFHFMPRAAEAGERVFRGQNKPGGKLVQGHKEEHWSWANEQRYLWSENAIVFDPRNEESGYQAARTLFEFLSITWKEGEVGTNPFNLGPLADMTGDRVGNAAKYVRKVKNHFDPENRSKTMEYVDPNVSDTQQKLMTYIRPLVVSRLGKHMIAKMISKKGM